MLVVFVLVVSASIQAGGGPRNVAVVINNRSAASREIGRYYQQARGIPESNIITISCPDYETITREECERWIVSPIRQCLNRPDVHGRIDYIVLTKGVPLRAGSPNQDDPHSIASMLTCLATRKSLPLLPILMAPLPGPPGDRSRRRLRGPTPSILKDITSIWSPGSMRSRCSRQRR